MKFVHLAAHRYICSQNNNVDHVVIREIKDEGIFAFPHKMQSLQVNGFMRWQQQSIQ